MLPPIHLVQLNPIVGDMNGNADRIRTAYDDATTNGAALVVFPECALIGYGAEDLLLCPHFQRAAMVAAQELAAYTRGRGAAMLLGSLWVEGQRVTNAALWLEDGEIRHIRHKHELPNEGVFDEWRTFAQGALPEVIEWWGHRLGVMICADLWHERVAAHLSAESAELFIVINASPYEHDKDAKRKDLARNVAVAYHAPVIYLNLCGGQDELMFDGGSFAVDALGAITQQFPYFQEHTEMFALQNAPLSVPDKHSLTYSAMMMGLRDYLHKSGFSNVVLGLSGGIDSALTAVVAVDALGAEHVHCIMLPSPFTSEISYTDAAALAAVLGVRYDVIPITANMEAMESALTPLGVITSLAQENIQSRLRAAMLMAISNSTGALLLTTGNKSELAVGYATLYGDMCGAYSVLKDVYKTDVFALARWRGTHHPVGALGGEGAIIPERILTRAPSAELRADQTDQDSLPPYAVLDGILQLLIEGRASVQEVVTAGYERVTVAQVVRLLKQSEYKRSQAPIGVKLTSMAFGRDWRMPLSNGYELPYLL
jgi:NAD+ synthase